VRPQVNAALDKLRSMGIKVEVVGSFARDYFQLHSDVDLLVLDAADFPDSKAILVFSTCVTRCEIDLHIASQMAPESLEFMLRDAGLPMSGISRSDQGWTQSPQ
jgi:predicted nucleotidyltransferase